MPEIVNDLMKGGIIGIGAVLVNYIAGTYVSNFVGAGAIATIVVVALGYAGMKMLKFA